MSMLNNTMWGITHGLKKLGSPGAFLSQQIITWAVAMGLTWFRIQLDASKIWTTQSDTTGATWAWNQLDDAISKLQAAGMWIVFPLRSPPSWALLNPSQKATDEPWYLWDPVSIGIYASAVATRYNGQQSCISGGINYGPLLVHSIESENEGQNIHSTAPGKGYHGLYNSPWALYNGINGVLSSTKPQPARDPHFATPPLKVVYPAVKAASPGCLVGMCAMWWVQPVNTGVPNTPVSNYTAFLTQMMLDGAASYMDYANFHYYSNKSDPSVTSHSVNSFAQSCSDIEAVLDQYAPTMPYWLTEVGWNTLGSTTTSSTQIPTPGTYTVTPAKITNGMNNNAQITVDIAPNQETVTIFNVTDSTFDATFTLAHTGTWSINANTDCDQTTQNTRYQYVLNTAKAHPRLKKLFIYTLDDQQSGTDGSSLIQWNGTTYAYLPAYTTVVNAIAGNPITNDPPYITTIATARDGQVVATARAGSVVASARDGQAVTTARDGNVAATARDGNVLATAR